MHCYSSFKRSGFTGLRENEKKYNQLIAGHLTDYLFNKKSFIIRSNLAHQAPNGKTNRSNIL